MVVTEVMNLLNDACFPVRFQAAGVPRYQRARWTNQSSLPTYSSTCGVILTARQVARLTENTRGILTATAFPGGGDGDDEPPERPVLPRALPGRYPENTRGILTSLARQM